MGTMMLMVARKDGRQNHGIIYYQCQNMGHYASELLEKGKKFNDEGIQILIYGFTGEDAHGF